MDDPPAPRTLKERIALLAANVNKPLTSSGSSSPSSPSFAGNRSYVPRVNVPKRRAPPPVPPKRTSSLPPPLHSHGSTPTGGYSHGYREDKVQEVMTRVIFQAGVDYESVALLLLVDQQ